MAGSGNTFHFQNYPSPIDTQTTYLPHFEIIPPNIHHNNPITTAVESPSKKQKTSPSNNNNKNGTPKMFQCQFCPRKYGSYKALGGHQNAHRRELAAVRAAASLSLSSPVSPPWPSVSPARNVHGHDDQQYYGYGYGYGYGENEGYFGNVVDSRNVMSFSAPPVRDVFHGGYVGGSEGYMMMGFDQGVASLSPSHYHHEVIINNHEDGGLNLDLTLGTFN